VRVEGERERERKREKIWSKAWACGERGLGRRVMQVLSMSASDRVVGSGLTDWRAKEHLKARKQSDEQSFAYPLQGKCDKNESSEDTRANGAGTDDDE
jgi:hypothetical protein